MEVLNVIRIIFSIISLVLLLAISWFGLKTFKSVKQDHYGLSFILWIVFIALGNVLVYLFITSIFSLKTFVNGYQLFLLLLVLLITNIAYFFAFIKLVDVSPLSFTIKLVWPYVLWFCLTIIILTAVIGYVPSDKIAMTSIIVVTTTTVLILIPSIQHSFILFNLTKVVPVKYGTKIYYGRMRTYTFPDIVLIPGELRDSYAVHDKNTNEYLTAFWLSDNKRKPRIYTLADKYLYTVYGNGTFSITKKQAPNQEE